VAQITRQRGIRSGRHHLVTPGGIISEYLGDFIGIRSVVPAPDDRQEVPVRAEPFQHDVKLAGDLGLEVAGWPFAWDGVGDFLPGVPSTVCPCEQRPPADAAFRIATPLRGRPVISTLRGSYSPQADKAASAPAGSSLIRYTVCSPVSSAICAIPTA
jgi:hypothetical protein